MRLIISIAILLFITATTASAEIAFFNTEVLGRTTGDTISLLEKHENNNEKLIQPKIIQVDVENGVYTASSVYYPASEIKFVELVSLIEDRYQVPKHIESDSGNFFI